MLVQLHMQYSMFATGCLSYCHLLAKQKIKCRAEPKQQQFKNTVWLHRANCMCSRAVLHHYSVEHCNTSVCCATVKDTKFGGQPVTRAIASILGKFVTGICNSACTFAALDV